MFRRVHAAQADLSGSDVDVNTDASHILSSICIVLELVAGRQGCQPEPNSRHQTTKVLQQLSKSAVLLTSGMM